MNLSISHVATPSIAQAAKLANVKEASRPLAQALRAGDVAAAKAAYVDIVRQAPEGAHWRPDSPFAELGKALLVGNVDAAKAAFLTMLKGAPASPPIDALPPAPASMASTTGGVSGSLLGKAA